MTQTPQLANPYRADTGRKGRIQADASWADYMLIKCIRPEQGTIMFTMATLWSKLCNELRERNILDNTKCNEFEQFLSTARLVSADEYANYIAYRDGANTTSGPSSPSSRSVSETNRGNVRGRTKRIRKVHTDEQAVGGDVPSDGATAE